MRPADFIRSRLLDRERKFIGLMRIPEVHFGAVRNEICRWILVREQEMARQLGKQPPERFPVNAGPGGCVTDVETDNRSLIEFAVSSDMEQVGAALRYFHFYVDRKGRTAARNFIQIDKEGFITTFVFQRNSVTREIFLWVRLEYCHSSLWPARRMPPTTPRIFNEIIKKIPGVKLIVHEQTPVDVVEREWSSSLRYEDVEAAVKRERRKAARAGERAAALTKPEVDVSFPSEPERLLEETPAVPAKPALAGLLAELRRAVANLREACSRFPARKNM